MLNLAVINFKLNDDMKLAINVGLIGSFTTFSLIMIDLIHLIKTPILLVIYYLITILGGLFMSYTAYLFALYFYKRVESRSEESRVGNTGRLWSSWYDCR